MSAADTSLGPTTPAKKAELAPLFDARACTALVTPFGAAGFQQHHVGAGDVEHVPGHRKRSEVGGVFEGQVQLEIGGVEVGRVAGNVGPQAAQHNGGAGAQLLPQGVVGKLVLPAVIQSQVAFKVFDNQAANVHVVLHHQQLHGVGLPGAVVGNIENPVDDDARHLLLGKRRARKY